MMLAGQHTNAISAQRWHACTQCTESDRAKRSVWPRWNAGDLLRARVLHRRGELRPIAQLGVNLLDVRRERMQREGVAPGFGHPGEVDRVRQGESALLGHDAVRPLPGRW